MPTGRKNLLKNSQLIETTSSSLFFKDNKILRDRDMEYTIVKAGKDKE